MKGHGRAKEGEDEMEEGRKKKMKRKGGKEEEGMRQRTMKFS